MRGTLILVIVAAVLSGCSSTPEPGAGGAAQAPTPAVYSPVPAKTIGEWKRRTADQFGAVMKGLFEVSGAIQDYDLANVRVGCTDLRAGIDNLEHALPSPDENVNAALRAMIDAYRAAVKLGPTISNGNSLDGTSQLLNQGSSQMYEAFDLMGLGVKPTG